MAKCAGCGRQTAGRICGDCSDGGYIPGAAAGERETMTFGQTVRRACDSLVSQGIDEYTAAPPLWRTCWAVGINIPPPHFLSFRTLVLVFGSVYVAVVGGLLWLVQWASLMDIPGFIIGFVMLGGWPWFSFYMAGNYEQTARRLQIPSWKSYLTAPAEPLPSTSQIEFDIWYSDANDTPVGPRSSSEVAALVRSGVLPRTVEVWTERLGAWTPADRVPGLLADGAPTPRSTRGFVSSDSRSSMAGAGAFGFWAALAFTFLWILAFRADAREWVLSETSVRMATPRSMAVGLAAFVTMILLVFRLGLRFLAGALLGGISSFVILIVLVFSGLAEGMSRSVASIQSPGTTITQERENAEAGDGVIRANDGTTVRLHRWVDPWVAESRWTQLEPGTRFASADVEVCAGSRSIQVMGYGAHVVMIDNTRYRPQSSNHQPALPLYSDVRAGDCVRGWITFTVPEGLGIKQAYVHFGDVPFTTADLEAAAADS